MKHNIVEAPSIKAPSDEGSWCSYGSGTSESDSSSNSSVCEAVSPTGKNVISKRTGSSFGISESGSGGITFGNFDESFLQFGDLLDTEVSVKLLKSHLEILMSLLFNLGDSLDTESSLRI